MRGFLRTKPVWNISGNLDGPKGSSALDVAGQSRGLQVEAFGIALAVEDSKAQSKGHSSIERDSR